MTFTLHHPTTRSGQGPTLAAALVRAAITLLLVTGIVAAAAAGATWIASQVLVSLLG